jgi:hypothetical protein
MNFQTHASTKLNIGGWPGSMELGSHKENPFSKNQCACLDSMISLSQKKELFFIIRNRNSRKI